ncbi:flagellar assembly protein FliW [Anaerocolumna xylanovorans]|uniref:Flagellar assembly factor FliW n=1 Tax=Anaerocolumna xylanovorans DSM 12503 TaxID=1121345 RepID=A0A1M7Y7Y5_9FIRM|nr:flagellar assembly protein FliW [Anaerocolumna xylanovorans]SHO48744.1 flagellar assembly factor FliW [Anaerocolumna xylanovorans DSM 12503]
MFIKTKYFGEIDLEEDKIIEFPQGVMGFEEYIKYTILYDIEEGEKPMISWLQCVEEPGLAIPVMNPLYVKADYNPTIEDALLTPLGEISDENALVLVTITVPEDKTKVTVNLKAPFIINSDTRKGCQIIVENNDYPVRYNIYEVIRKMKEVGGE